MDESEEKPLTEKQNEKTSPAIFILMAAAIFSVQVATVATTNWVTSPAVQAGLWKLCHTGECNGYNGVRYYIQLVRGFLISSTIFSGGAIISSFMLCMRRGKRSSSAMLHCLVFCTSGICTMISMVIFTIQYPLADGLYYGYSYSLGWTAVGMCCIASPICAMFSRRK